MYILEKLNFKISWGESLTSESKWGGGGGGLKTLFHNSLLFLKKWGAEAPPPPPSPSPSAGPEYT